MLIVAAWQVPFFLALDWQSVKAVWSEEGTFGSRLDYSQLGVVVCHWLLYPLKVFVSLMPWSAMLPCYLVPSFRRSLGAAAPYVAFLTTCLLVAFPTCWFPADSVPHYFMPLFPCVAILVGLAAERCWQADRKLWWQKGWTRYLRGTALAILGGALFVAFVCIWPDISSLRFRQPPWFTAVYLVCVGVTITILVWNCQSTHRSRVRLAVLALAGFLGLSHTGLVLNGRLARFNDSPSAIAQLKAQLPPGTTLVSFGKLHHRFTYYYQDLITLGEWPKSAYDLDPSIEYFCFPRTPGQVVNLPFEWEEIAVVSCDRCCRPAPNNAVVVGHRASRRESVAGLPETFR